MSCYHGIFLVLIYNKEVTLINPKVKKLLPISYLEDDPIIAKSKFSVSFLELGLTEAVCQSHESMSLHSSRHIGKQIYRMAHQSGILVVCCSVRYQTPESSLHHLFHTGGQGVGAQWSEMQSVDRTGSSTLCL